MWHRPDIYGIPYGTIPPMGGCLLEAAACLVIVCCVIVKLPRRFGRVARYK